MATLGFTFNPSQAQELPSFGVIPKGEYVAIIENTESKQSKNGSWYLSITWQIVEGQFSGRKIFQNLSLWSEDSTSKNIALSHLGGICNAISIQSCEETEVLHEKPMIIRVAIKPATNGYDEKNEVKGYAPYQRNQSNRSSPAQQAPQVATRPAAPVVDDDIPVWAR